jgi:hypothetical protein
VKRIGSIVALVVAAAVAAPTAADAFCGFYVSPGDQQMFADATQVVLMRKGTRTVLSMQNNYKGPPSDFAMVIPVPVVLHEDDVKTLAKDVFAHVEQMGAPRLVEYWEQDPCYQEPPPPPPMASAPMAMKKMAPREHVAADLGVTIEAKFEVGEYKILILSAKDSTGLDTWLRQEHYKIPAGAEPLLRPYVEGGMKFFVAKVDPQKVLFENGRAALSPLRFHYDSEDFALPIRLGLANSSGTQDLIVNILAPHQRYEVANYKNVTIPTNIDVKDSVRDHFASFYAALFDRTVEMNPGAVVTEYAWQATTCDPCPGPALNYHDFMLLGADVLDGNQIAAPTPPPPPGGGMPSPRIRRMPPRYGMDFVLTRLHARYGKSIKDDLHFKEATPIVGGREFVQSQGKLEEGARPDSTNNFQGRYAIRHEWTGPIACDNPKRGVWGGPPGRGYGSRPSIKPALELAFAPRGGVALQEVVKRDLPEIGVQMGVAPTPAPRVAEGEPTSPPPVVPPAKKTGCGCDAGDGALGSGALAALALVIIRRRRPS